MNKNLSLVSVLVVVLIVLGVNATQAHSAPPCPDDVHRIECLGEQVSRELSERGIPAAFQMFRGLYENEPSFSKNCHAVAHEMGKAAYGRFKHSERLEPTAELSYCSYGFYHGFFEALVPDTGDPTGARKLCDLLEAAVIDGRSIIAACLHGFGHGITDGNNPELWGSAERMVKPGLAVCLHIGKDEEEQGLCAGGVFNALAPMYFESVYDLTLDYDNPYALCEEQEYSPFRKACYRNLHPIVARINNNNFLPAARQVESIQDERNAALALDNLAMFQARLFVDVSKNELITPLCYRLKSSLQAICISGFATGFMIFSTPGQEYKRAIYFCEQSEMLPEHQGACFERILSNATEQYPWFMRGVVCGSIPQEYRYLCNQENLQ